MEQIVVIKGYITFIDNKIHISHFLNMYVTNTQVKKQFVFLLLHITELVIFRENLSIRSSKLYGICNSGDFHAHERYI